MNIFKLLTIAVSILVFSGISAQENQNEYRTIFNSGDDKKVSYGGYGAFSFGYTTIDSKSALLMGLKGAWVIDHHFAIGLAGYGFFNNLSKTQNSNDYYLGGGYGGFYFEPIVAPKSSVHVSFPIFIGGGGVTTFPQNYWEYNFYPYGWDYDAFFVFEPGVELEFNLVKFFRLAVGASYRLTNGVILQNNYYSRIPTNALNAFNFYVIFKFGKF
jgi:hypothetical protein